MFLHSNYVSLNSQLTFTLLSPTPHFGESVLNMTEHHKYIYRYSIIDYPIQWLNKEYIWSGINATLINIKHQNIDQLIESTAPRETQLPNPVTNPKSWVATCNLMADSPSLVARRREVRTLEC